MILTNFIKIKKTKKEIVLGIGKFDGVHSGHKRILEIVSKTAEREGRAAGVFTFKTFPVEFLLCSWEEKLALLKKEGIQRCIWSDFEDIARLSPDEFLDILVEAGVKRIVVGYNFRFGKERRGDIRFLKDAAKKKGFSVIVMPPYKKKGKVVSASLIRKVIKQGDIKTANTLLGRYWSVSGKVIKGKGIGWKLGFPTANLSLDKDICVEDGVYAGWALCGRRVFKAAIVAGSSPTFNGDTDKLEVFLIGFQGNKNLYNRQLQVFFYKKIRAQRRFEDERELQRQIETDVRKIKSLLRRTLPPKL
ncbi:MAG: riboflavin biosynthesis protein RibF [Elusimicrobia bacterium]|nr:riboflavin biosynthesis protein RibF [Elusimicrobiota bacterium]